MLKSLAMGMLAAGLVTTVACGRTDSGVTKSVESGLAKDETTKSSDVSVDTGKKTVTLNGTVATTEEKEQAVAIARNTKGAKDVVDDIVVNRNAAATSGTAEPKSSFSDDVQGVAHDAKEKTERAADKTGDAIKDAAHDTKVGTEKAASKTGEVITDASITTAIKTQYLARPGVPGFKIDVDTNDNVVTLSGTVKDSAEVAKAVRIASDTKGVKRVVNHLKVE